MFDNKICPLMLPKSLLCTKPIQHWDAPKVKQDFPLWCRGRVMPFPGLFPQIGMVLGVRSVYADLLDLLEREQAGL